MAGIDGPGNRKQLDAELALLEPFFRQMQMKQGPPINPRMVADPWMPQGQQQAFQGREDMLAQQGMDPRYEALIRSMSLPQQEPVGEGPGLLARLAMGIGGGMMGRPELGPTLLQRERENRTAARGRNIARQEQYQKQISSIALGALGEDTRKAERKEDIERDEKRYIDETARAEKEAALNRQLRRDEYNARMAQNPDLKDERKAQDKFEELWDQVDMTLRVHGSAEGVPANPEYQLPPFPDVQSVKEFLWARASLWQKSDKQMAYFEALIEDLVDRWASKPEEEAPAPAGPEIWRPEAKAAGRTIGAIGSELIAGPGGASKYLVKKQAEKKKAWHPPMSK